MSATIDEVPEKRTVLRKRNFFEYLFIKFNTFYENLFSTVGRQIGNNPYIFILISFLLTGLCSLGFLRLNMINNSDDLFVPTDCKSLQDRDIIAKILPMNYNEYYLHQDYDLGIFGDVIFLAKDYGNIKRLSVRNELKRIYTLIQKINVTYNNQTYSYQDLCAKRDGRCVTEGDMFFRETFWQRLKDKELHKYLLTDLYTDDDGVPNLLPFIFGKNLKINVEKGLLFTKVVKLRFNLRRTLLVEDKNVNIEVISRMWEQAF